jgi:hypothetical protein
MKLFRKTPKPGSMEYFNYWSDYKNTDHAVYHPFISSEAALVADNFLAVLENNAGRFLERNVFMHVDLNNKDDFGSIYAYAINKRFCEHLGLSIDHLLKDKSSMNELSNVSDVDKFKNWRNTRRELVAPYIPSYLSRNYRIWLRYLFEEFYDTIEYYSKTPDRHKPIMKEYEKILLSAATIVRVVKEYSKTEPEEQSDFSEIGAYFNIFMTELENYVRTEFPKHYLFYEAMNSNPPSE